MSVAARVRSEPWKAFQARERNPGVKREAVLHTAAHMFLESGYRQTSMNDLAQRLQITKPALYYYFTNKEQILIGCYELGIDVIEHALDQASAETGTGLAKLRAYIEGYAVSVLLHEFGRCVAMLDDKELSPATRHEVRSLKRQIDNSLMRLIEEGVADGSIDRCNSKLATFAISGAINWIGTWYKPEGTLSAEEISREFAHLLTAGLAHRG